MESTSKEAKINYPRFITDKPEGKDLYIGKSQARIAENINQFIIENETSKRKVIGIEGEWGSGKSNVIEILKNRLKEKYYFFVFDAWGHQEDLTRRSILEGLLSKLINDNELDGKKEKWEKELKTLLSKKIEKQSRSVPKLSWAVLLAVIGIILMPITKFMTEHLLNAYIYPNSTHDFWNYLFAALILISPFSFLGFWIAKSLIQAEKGERKKVFEELFYIYKGKEIENTSVETISEEEPTVQEFTRFLLKLENDTKKILVIVFDNMDRLPAAKVKEIWSSIHTFFASDDNDLKTWAIVPFDNEHISNIFIEDKKDESKDDKHRADSYIHKTFSIVFHVAPPILSGWKGVLSSKFNDAFGFTPPQDQLIETIFDYYHSSDPKIKPRDIICFVNDLVALKKLWNDEIPFKYLALFALKRTDIMKNPFDAILSKTYLNSLATLFESDEQLASNISALAFNVPIEFADEILLKSPIEKVLRGEGNFNAVCNHKSFFTLLDSVLYSSKPDLIHSVSSFEDLPKEIRDKPEMQNYWEWLSESLLRIEKFDLKYVDSIKTLARRLKNHSATERLLKYLFTMAISKEEKEQKFYHGTKYQELISDIDSLLKEVWKEKAVEELLSDNNVEPEEYFELLNVCPNDYVKYKVSCEIKKLNDFLIAKFNANEISPYLKHLTTITDLSEFKAYINGIIPTLAPTLPNYDSVLSNIYDVGKILSSDGKLLFVIPEDTATLILAEMPTHNRAVDLLLSIISGNISNPKNEHLNNANCVTMLGDVNLQNTFIDAYESYLNYGDLIKYNLEFPSLLIKSVITELTKSSNILKGADIEFLLSKYVAIRADIFDGNPELCHLFIDKINSFYVAKNSTFVSDESLSYIIPLIRENYSLDCNLINDIISQANKFIDDLDKDTWLSSLKESDTSKNIELFRALIDSKKYSNDKLRQTVNTAYLELVRTSSKKENPIPSNMDFWNMFFDMLKGNFTTNFKNVRDELLNYIHADVTIGELLFFEKGLFQYGKLSEDQKYADDTLRRILIPLATSGESYVNILKRNVLSIKEIIEKANDSIIDFKNALDSNCPSIFDDPEFKPAATLLNSKFHSLSEESNRKKSKTKKTEESTTEPVTPEGGQ